MKKLRYFRVLALALCATFATVSCNGLQGDDPEVEDYYLTVKPGDAVFPAEGGSIEFSVATNAKHTDCSFPKRDWLTVGYDKSINKYVVTVDANDSGEERAFTLTFYCYNTTDEKKEDTRTVSCAQPAAAAEQGSQPGEAPEGALGGLFTINSSGKTVRFSQGNLQYKASNKTWRFAEHQWDYVGFKYYVETGDDYFEWVYTGTVSGNTNENISSSNSGWIDVFGWGTSGYDGRYPYMTVLDPSYYSIGNGNSIAGTKYDWGVYNAISNGGNQAGLWRTLTRDEWEYILVSRSAPYRCAPATVADVHGLILLPDNWNPSTYYLDNINVEEWYNWYVNDISAADWTSKLEPAGAVFLPCAGSRGNINYPDEETVGGGTGPEGILGFSGCYWSSTLFAYNSSELDDELAYCMMFLFNNGDPSVSTDFLCYGLSVRLVSD